MAEYQFQEIEQKWRAYWQKHQTFKTSEDTVKPKYYILDMFPYPSGSGLHVGHPLGYIATDIIARFKRIKGYNVLHPMGYDSFGLPAEQYAIQTGQHPAITTANNIKRYREQLDNLGFSYDWSREVRTSDASYYKWTQWIFKQLYNSWYNINSNKAEPIETLVSLFENDGNLSCKAVCDDDTPEFTSDEWVQFTEEQKQRMLLKYRLTYLAETSVNWCPALGTVLSNDEVKDGFSERGGHPVVKKKMPQWNMRITAYADRLLSGLDTISWPESIKEMQRNWIGKSVGAELDFRVDGHDLSIRVFTTRIDTIYGVTFMTLAPENELVNMLTTDAQRSAVDQYVEEATNRTERERMSEVKRVSGVFTGSYAINPFSGTKVPIWIGDYVLAGYGTGAVMGVPSGDQRDYDFAKHFDLPIVPAYDTMDISTQADPTKKGKMINSGILDGLEYAEAIKKAIGHVESKKIGKAKVNFRLRDAVFGRQRYWGEPFPVYYKDGMPFLVADQDLPVTLPDVDKFLPTEDGEPPLGRAENWRTKEGYEYELTTMPGWAGSSWYFFRYMDPTNEREFASQKALNYWKEVDFYMGGAEHATGHLLYSRFWTKFLYDLGHVPVDEYAKKLVNQGMIGHHSFRVKINGKNKLAISFSLLKDGKDELTNLLAKYDLKISDFTDSFAPIECVNEKNATLDVDQFKAVRPDFENFTFISDSDGNFICEELMDKMSKSKFNVVNPDELIEKYGADTLRMYEMFLGPIEQHKPWNTNGIDGVYKFLRKFWRLFHDQDGKFSLSEETATKDELKVLHKVIKKIEEDIERLSLNTSVSSFMIATNELASLNCNKRAILEPFVILISPFAPHIAEELWQLIGHNESITNASYPVLNEEYLKESEFEYPIMINGKLRAKMNFDLSKPASEIETEVRTSEIVEKWSEGKPVKKIIVVPGKIVNVVL
uniref:leucine--tRNA ligase n=1 Tax=Fulvivirga sp. TaxID=1931237 RepID=UPI00404A69C6